MKSCDKALYEVPVRKDRSGEHTPYGLSLSKSPIGLLARPWKEMCGEANSTNQDLTK